MVAGGGATAADRGKNRGGFKGVFRPNGRPDGGDIWWEGAPEGGGSNETGGEPNGGRTTAVWAENSSGDRGKNRAGAVTSGGSRKQTAGPMALKIGGDDLWWKGKRMVVTVH